MIEVEAAQVVLVRLALAAVLADDQARHRFEDFASPHHRACIQLRGRHRALARRAGDPDQVRRRVLDVGDVTKRVRRR